MMRTFNKPAIMYMNKLLTRYVSPFSFDGFRMEKKLKDRGMSDKDANSISAALDSELREYSSFIISKSDFEMEKCRRDAEMEVMKTRFFSHQDEKFLQLNNAINEMGTKLTHELEKINVRMDVLEKHLNLRILSVFFGGAAVVCGMVYTLVRVNDYLREKEGA